MQFVQYLLSIICLLPTASGAGPKVTLDSGIYEGVTTQLPGSSAIVHKYLGIPFAASPIRFAPAQPASTSKAERKADTLLPACIQSGGGGLESEDCLHLNVFAPAPKDGNLRAVMIWLYGGGLQSGSASLAMYDGTSFAANQDVIIVAPNYRTNVFGFPGEAPVVPIQSRNLGLLDQRLAFDWVQKYISKFGGDPSQVTVFGQSAGARSADFHLLTMKNPPFRAVIMESGSAELTPLADSSRAGRSGSKLPPLVQLATALGCNSEEKMLDCMRQVSAQKIKETIATKRLYFGSTNDGGFTTVRDQAVIRRSHLAANVSLLIGTNSDEQRSLLGNWKDWKLDQYLNGKFSSAEMRVEVAKAYAVGAKSAYKSDFEAIAAVETDLAFTCITSREAKISAESGYPTWRYLFSASAPKEGVSKSGSLHADEIPFVFGNLITQNNSLTPEHIALSKQMQQVWAQFAKYPNRGPGWSIVGASENDLGKFGSDGKLVVQSSKGLDQNCKLFEKLYEGRA